MGGRGRGGETSDLTTSRGLALDTYGTFGRGYSSRMGKAYVGAGIQERLRRGRLRMAHHPLQRGASLGVAA